MMMSCSWVSSTIVFEYSSVVLSSVGISKPEFKSSISEAKSGRFLSTFVNPFVISLSANGSEFLILKSLRARAVAAAA